MREDVLIVEKVVCHNVVLLECLCVNLKYKVHVMIRVAVPVTMMQQNKGLEINSFYTT